MKRKLLAICLCLLPLLASFAEAAPAVSASRAILMDAKTGLVLYEKNAHEKAYPASTTKVMTAILALEKGNLDDKVEVSFNAVNSISYDSSKAGLFEGESFSLREMVYALLICSANDAANVIAEHIGGDISGFVSMMNSRAAELGTKNTHFVNTHGLHNTDHYTTAYDLALLARHALTLPEFREIVAMRSYVLEPTDKYEEKRYLNSTNHLLNPQSEYYYSEAIGVKTGYTDEAKSCLVSASQTENGTYIAVVLGAESMDGKTMSFVDSRTLLRYGTEYCLPTVLCEANASAEGIPVAKAKNTDMVAVHTQDTVSAILPEGVSADAVQKLEYIKKDLEAPVEAGTVLGRVEYRYGDLLVGQTYLVANEDVEKRSLILNFFAALFSSFWTWGILVILLLAVIIVRTRKKRAKNRRIRRAEIRRRNRYQ